MRRLIAGCAIALVLFTACNPQPKTEYAKYTNSALGSFDTLITLVAYTKTEAEFNGYFEQAKTRFAELHQLYDIYHNYEGINNLKTINDNAGVKPVQVAWEILDLIRLAKEWAYTGKGQTNIALGPVLAIWHEYRTEGLDDPDTAALPPRDLVLEAAKYTESDDVIIDEEKSTVFLKDRRMKLDVGALAKGFATELVARELEAAGLKSGAIGAGGNIRTIGKPLDGIREKWGIGIQDPNSTLFSEDRNLDTLYVNDLSVVTSGDYQRYYYVDGQRYHHLINPATLMPAAYYRAVTVVAPDSGLADLLSTELFLLPYEESRKLADSLNDVEAMWVLPDGEVRITEGMKAMLRSHGATGKN